MLKWRKVRDELKLLAPLLLEPLAEHFSGDLATLNKCSAKVAIVMTTENQWVTEIERQGDSFNQHRVEFSWYSALRQLGLAVDFISPDSELTGYQLVVAPCLPIVSQAFVDRCKASQALLVFGPRSGAKTAELSLVPQLGPGLLQQLVPVKVLSTETIRPDCYESLHFTDASIASAQYQSTSWREELAVPADVTVLARYHDQSPAVVQHGNCCYVATLTCQSFLLELFAKLATAQQIPLLRLNDDLRVVQRGALQFVFNYGSGSHSFDAPAGASFLIGCSQLAPFDVAVLQLATTNG